MDVNIKHVLQTHQGMDLKYMQKVNCSNKNSIERALFSI